MLPIYIDQGIVKMSDYQNLSENELKAVIERAEIALKNKQVNKRKEVIAKIKELAASIDATVEIHEEGKKAQRAASKIPVKYRHPKDADKTWTGRGMTPKWMQALLDKGHDRTEFKV
jgi:DNA-binding protein H-NS